jgi:hypothetical protein
LFAGSAVKIVEFTATSVVVPMLVGGAVKSMVAPLLLTPPLKELPNAITSPTDIE